MAHDYAGETDNYPEAIDSPDNNDPLDADTITDDIEALADRTNTTKSIFSAEHNWTGGAHREINIYGDSASTKLTVHSQEDADPDTEEIQLKQDGTGDVKLKIKADGSIVSTGNLTLTSENSTGRMPFMAPFRVFGEDNTDLNDSGALLTVYARGDYTPSTRAILSVKKSLGGDDETGLFSVNWEGKTEGEFVGSFTTENIERDPIIILGCNTTISPVQIANFTDQSFFRRTWAAASVGTGVLTVRVPLKAGDIITDIEIGYSAVAGGSIQVRLLSFDTAGVSEDYAVESDHTYNGTGGYTKASTAENIELLDVNGYIILLNLDNNNTLNGATLYYIKISYERSLLK